MNSSGAGAVAAPARHAGHMSKRGAVFLLGGHGARDEGSKRSSRSETEKDPFLNLRGDTDVIIYTPVGDSREGVESGQILKNGVYTNTSLAPSIAVDLVCGPDKCDPRLLLKRMSQELQLLDNLAGVKYKNPGELFQINPTEDKNIWAIFMGEQFRQKRKGATKEMFARVAAGDGLHFPFGLTFLTLYDEDGRLYKEPLSDHEGKPTIASFMLGNNCHLDLRKAEFDKKPELLKELKENRSIVTDVVEPFAQSETKGVKTHWADLNLLSARNSGQINRAITEIANGAKLRIARGTGSEHDEWLVANEGFVIDCLNEVQTTKQSKLSKLVFICKYILPPETDIEIVDQTCSSDFTKQPVWGAVTTSTTDSVESFPPYSPSSESEESDDDSSDSDDSWWLNNLFGALWQGWCGFSKVFSGSSSANRDDCGSDPKRHAGHAGGGSRKSRKRTTVRRKKITRKTKKRAYKKKSQKRNRRK
jgi:hypothetical protein